ncbi:N-acetyltransferase [Lysobacter pythonis]|uniref:N-acetyltransferase n=1 Tax=Solilutibacter pythonis TaxID=2483112 RepID=A0A3M2I3F4_9GAMM|nr:GNAT family N-acetyltransferase [Lysobacter pythonis]RMH94855.1 N-acetyltransferase [Lysobacter pythonis]
MISLENCEFLQLRSSDDEAAFFALMGRFFASATVRRECGGYPLNDGPRYRWFIVKDKHQARVLGFISVERQPDVIRIRECYVRSEARGHGLFRVLRQQVLDYIDDLELGCTMRVPEGCAAYLTPYGFQVRSARGRWVSLVRSTHATSRETGGTGQKPVPGTGLPAVETANRSHQPNTPAFA